MGRKQNNKKLKKDQQPSQEEISQQEQDDDQQDQVDQDEFDDQLQADIDGDSVLLKKIEDRILQVGDEEKLSWAAIYQVKKQESQMNEQMQKQIDAIKEKYEVQRIPLMHKISQAVAGRKLDKSIYAENQFVKSINLNKTKPKLLQDYWGKVFDGCGLIGHEDDIELLEKLTIFKVDLIDAKVQNIKLTFEFEDNEYFGNKIEIQVTGSVADGTFTKKIDCTPKTKVADENSLFGLLTGKDTDDQQLLDTCHDLYRSYISSTYFYFYQPTDDLDGEEDEEDGQQGEDDQENDDDQEVQAVQKPKGSSIKEKPECKQQ